MAERETVWLGTLGGAINLSAPREVLEHQTTRAMTGDIPATCHKLEEAFFFLQNLERAEVDRVKDTPASHAAFYFSAFVSAARSVTFALQVEEGAAAKIWYDAWLSARNADDAKLLQIFNQERVAEVKKTGSQTSAIVEAWPMQWAPRHNAINLGRVAYWEGIQQPLSRILYCRFKRDGGYGEPEAVLPLAQRYFSILESLVESYKTAHFAGEPIEPES